MSRQRKWRGAGPRHTLVTRHHFHLVVLIAVGAAIPTQPLGVRLNALTREILRAVAVASLQLGRFLLPVQDVQTVAATVRAAAAFEHAATVVVVVAERGRALDVGEADPARGRARDDAVLGGRFEHVGPADFDAPLAEFAERRAVAVAVHQRLALVGRDERDQRALTVDVTLLGLAGDQVGTVDHVVLEREAASLPLRALYSRHFAARCVSVDGALALAANGRRRSASRGVDRQREAREHEERAQHFVAT